MRLLVIDDEKPIREVLRARLEADGHEVATAATGGEGLGRVDSFAPQAVVADVKLPDRSGVELLREIAARRPELPVILITAHATVDLAVEAMKLGARDFLTKPLDHDQLRALLRDVEREREDRRRTRREAEALERSRSPGGEIVGRSAPMREVFRQIEEVAPIDAAVFLSGESGTGKELVARAIHRAGPRSRRELVAVNAAAIPEDLMESEIFGHEKGAFTGAAASRKGCFELADGGTLLLDEIAEMPLALQPKLLRVLEDGTVRRLGGSRELTFDVRLMAATNQEPETAVREGRLRQDLFYRLHVFPIRLPPLRDRLEDLPLLEQHFLRRFNDKHGTAVEGLRDEARRRLERHRWPGNVRELRNVLERAVVLAKTGWIEARHLPPYLEDPGRPPEETLELPAEVTLEEAERRLILETLSQTGGNKAEAARRLGIDVKTVRNKLKRYAEDS